MNTSTTYLDQALALGEEELKALVEGDVEKAVDLADRRSWLISQAWNLRAGSDTNAYVERLIKVQQLQDMLTFEARRRREEVRDGLIKSKKEGQRLTGYRNAVAHAM